MDSRHLKRGCRNKCQNKEMWHRKKNWRCCRVTSRMQSISPEEILAIGSRYFKSYRGEVEINNNSLLSWNKMRFHLRKMNILTPQTSMLLASYHKELPSWWMSVVSKWLSPKTRVLGLAVSFDPLPSFMEVTSSIPPQSPHFHYL